MTGLRVAFLSQFAFCVTRRFRIENKRSLRSVASICGSRRPILNRAGSTHYIPEAARIVANGAGLPLCDKKVKGEHPIFDPSIVTKFFTGVAENLRLDSAPFRTGRIYEENCWSCSPSPIVRFLATDSGLGRRVQKTGGRHSRV